MFRDRIIIYYRSPRFLSHFKINIFPMASVAYIILSKSDSLLCLHLTYTGFYLSFYVSVTLASRCHRLPLNGQCVDSLPWLFTQQMSPYSVVVFTPSLQKAFSEPLI